MGLLKTQKDKNIFVLALISAITSVLFSFMGAPFLRSLALSTKSGVFWLTAGLLIAVMFVAGLENYKISETAVYVGAVWMTLGSYSELEKRGINWRTSSVLSLVSGFLFALAGYFLILKNLNAGDILAEFVQPLQEASNKWFPNSELQINELKLYIPGIFIASLAGSLALGFVFEAKVSRMFRIQRERIVSSLRWIEFRLPDSAIWIFLVAALASIEFSNYAEWLRAIGINLVIVSIMAFFFQGIATLEFALRFYRFGAFTRALTYLLVILQLAPFIVFVGFVDHWADFRQLMRRKSKTTT